MKRFVSLIFRYIIILVSGLGSLSLFYKLFGPLTFYLSSSLLSLFGDVKLFPILGFFMFNSSAVYIVDACVAGSAYYLLFILIMSTANIPVLKRVKLAVIAFTSLLVFNVLRITLMTLIVGTIYFNSVHLVFWYFVSILFVLIIWFFLVRKFSIKEIPVYSDIKFLVKQVNGAK